MAEKKYNLTVDFYGHGEANVEKTGEEVAKWLRQVADLFESGCLPAASEVTVKVK